MATLTRDQQLKFFTLSILKALSADPVIASLMRNATRYTGATGSYSYGDTIDISIRDKKSVTVHTNFAVNPASTYTKGTVTNFPITLTALAEANIYYDELDRVVSSGNEPMFNALTRGIAVDMLEAIEEDLYIRTFNLASIDTNVVGTSATDLTVDDLIDLEMGIFQEREWKGAINLVLSPTYASQIKKNFKDAFTSLSLNDNMSLREGFILNAAPNIRFYTSTKLPTPATMSNITGAETTKLAFAFADESVALFNPAMRDESNDAVGIKVNNESAGGMKYQITRFSDGSKVINEHYTKMLALYGSGIFRPTLVVPIKGGGII